LRKSDFEVQRVVDLRRTRSLSDGGRFGFGAEVPQAFSKRLSPSQQTTHSRKGIARGACVSRGFRLTKEAYTKGERVCQRSEKATPALVKKAGVAVEHDLYGELLPLAIQHRILSCVSENVLHLAGEPVNRPIHTVI